VKAKPESWKSVPFPERRARLVLERTFDAAEWSAIEQGVVPEEMEDKWFVFEKEGWLFFHRSWTGYCVYQVRVEGTPLGRKIAEAWANRDPEQYKETDDAYDARLLSWLIDVLLLKRPALWPDSGLGDEALRQWSLVGRAMLEHDTDGKTAGELEKGIGNLPPKKRPERPGS
jgi:hypothetical protein